jgi:hypothetical protein
MGQYHLTVNLDKHEFIDPHKLGNGLKLVEQGGTGGIKDALHLLLAVSNGRGGGDFRVDSDMVGRWGGDRIAVVGDYAVDGDLKKKHKASTIYYRCCPEEDDDDVKGPTFRDITDELIPVLEEVFGVTYSGSGWVTRTVAGE